MTVHFTPAISAAGTIRLSRVFGHHEIRLSAEETGGTMGLWEEAANPGEGPRCTSTTARRRCSS